jgi:hypothetical protein
MLKKIINANNSSKDEVVISNRVFFYDHLATQASRKSIQHKIQITYCTDNQHHGSVRMKMVVTLTTCWKKKKDFCVVMMRACVCGRRARERDESVSTVRGHTTRATEGPAGPDTGPPPMVGRQRLTRNPSRFL